MAVGYLWRVDDGVADGVVQRSRHVAIYSCHSPKISALRALDRPRLGISDDCIGIKSYFT